MAIDWTAIKTEYITTDTSYRKLAEKYNVSRVQIGAVGKEEGWVELRRQFVDKTVTKTIEKISEQEAKRLSRFEAVADKLLERIERRVASDMPLDPKSMRAITASMKDLKEIVGIKSALDEKEQRARIANLEKQTEKDDNTADSIEVVFMAGPEEWNE